MSEILDLENSVIVVYERGVDLESATSRLAGAGYEFDVLDGIEGQEQVDPRGEKSLWAGLKRLVSAIGDENRVLRDLEAELEDGNVVVSIDTENVDPDEAVSVARESGGRSIWKFDGWSYVAIT